LRNRADFVGFTSFYESGQLHEALVKTQNLPAIVKAGTTVLIPHAREPLAPDRRNLYRSPIEYCRGIYLSGHNAGSRATLRNLAAWRKAGINTIVFDVKDIPGLLSYYSHVPQASEIGAHDKRSIEDVGKLIEIYKSHGFYVVARVSCFQDHIAARTRPEWPIRTASGGPGASQGGLA
jgi:hypothetical protein